MAVAFPTIPVTDLETADVVIGGNYVIVDQSDTTRKASFDTIVSDMRLTKIVFFSEGGFLESKKDLAFNEADQKYYTWNDGYPKIIPVASSPETTGGIGPELWQIFGSSAAGSTGVIDDLGDVTDTIAVDLTQGDTFLVNLTGGQATMTITNPSDAVRTSQMFTMALTQGTGANLVAWPSNVKWSYGRAPVLSYKQGVRDIFQFVTYDHGTNWFGTLVMAGVE